MRAEIQIDCPYYLSKFLKPIIESTGMSIKLLVQVKRVHSTMMSSPVRFFAHHGPCGFLFVRRWSRKISEHHANRSRKEQLTWLQHLWCCLNTNEQIPTILCCQWQVKKKRDKTPYSMRHARHIMAMKSCYSSTIFLWLSRKCLHMAQF